MVKLSVITPVHNTERFVAETIESILAQTCGDFEYIIIDDGSSDGSGRILDSFAAKDGRIRLVRRERRGIVASRNEGIELASGELIAVIDSDDVAMPDRLDVQIRYLQRHPECVAVGGAAQVIDPLGSPIALWSYPENHEEIDEANLQNDQKMLHSSLMMRRHAVLAVGGYQQQAETAEELDLLLRLAEYGRLANLPNLLVKYRRHSGSVSQTQRVRQVEASNFAMSEARRRRDMHHLSLPERSPDELRAPSVAEQHRLWAWCALSNRNIQTARFHAREAFKRGPLDPATWRVLFCVYRGY